MQPHSLPTFVVERAPLLHLHSQETNWPSDPAEHLRHVVPKCHGTEDIKGAPLKLTLANVDHPAIISNDVYLTSIDDATPLPQPNWITSEYGRTSARGKSSASVTCVLVDRGGAASGDVDAFYFFLYRRQHVVHLMPLTYDSRLHHQHKEHQHKETKKCLSALRALNLVRHALLQYTMIRFNAGQPEVIYLSHHGSGFTYTYDAVEKRDKRPVIYSAKGSHALYAKVGDFDPHGDGCLHDSIDVGPLWDPLHNLAAFPSASETSCPPAGPTCQSTSYARRCYGVTRHTRATIDQRQAVDREGHRASGDGPAFVADKTLRRRGLAEHAELPLYNSLAHPVPLVIS